MNHQIKRANRLILIIFLIFIFGSLQYGILTTEFPFLDTIYYNILIPQLLFILLPVTLFLLISKVNLKDLLRLNRLTIGEVLSCVAFAFFILPLSYLINTISMLFVKNDTSKLVSEMSESMPLSLMLLLIAILPALNEELLTRGILYQSYKKENIIKGALLSSLLFGMLHMNINQFLYAIVLGFIFVLLIEATDSIFSSMIAHFTINGIAAVNAFQAKNSEAAQQMLASEPTREMLLQGIFGLLIGAIIFTPIALLILYHLAKYNEREDHLKSILAFRSLTSSDTKIKSRLLTWHIYVCILLFVGISILNEFL